MLPAGGAPTEMHQPAPEDLNAALDFSQLAHPPKHSNSPVQAASRAVNTTGELAFRGVTPDPAEIEQSPGLARRLAATGLGLGLGLADRGLNWLASDPKAQASLVSTFGSMGLDLVPVLGPLKKYADARAMFKEDDALLKAEARKLCVIAGIEAAFDVATMGGSAFIPDEALTYLRSFRDYQRRIRKASNAAGLFPDPLSIAAGIVLKVPGTRFIVDKVLAFAVPAPSGIVVADRSAAAPGSSE